MFKLLKETIDGGNLLQEYTLDGVSVAYSKMVAKDSSRTETIAPQPSIEERLETIELSTAQTQIQVDYLAFMTELATMKGGEK